MPSSKSATATPFCKRCFKPIKVASFRGLFGTPSICYDCYKEFGPKWIRWKEGAVDCLALHDYNEAVRSSLYQFKGVGDVELASVFFSYPLPILQMLYHGFTLVPAPSSPSHNQARGFNQVEEMGKALGLPVLKALVKDEGTKQTDLSALERTAVGKMIHLAPKTVVKGKKILLLDDVFTTGSTARACLKLLARAGAKKLRLLVMAKTQFKGR